MAKRKKKPTKKMAKAVVKKVEPSIKAEAKVEEVILEAASDGAITEEEVAKIEEVKEEVKELEKEDKPKRPNVVIYEEVGDFKPSKHDFPTKETCKHSVTKRTLGRNSRVMHICTQCGTTVRFGGR